MGPGAGYSFRCKAYAGRPHSPCSGTTDDGSHALCRCPCHRRVDDFSAMEEWAWEAVGPLWFARYQEAVRRALWIERTARRLGLVRMPESLSEREFMRQEDWIERAMGRRFYPVEPLPGFELRVVSPAAFTRAIAQVLGETAVTNLPRDPDDPYDPTDDEPFGIIP